MVKSRESLYARWTSVDVLTEAFDHLWTSYSWNDHDVDIYVDMPISNYSSGSI